MSSQTHQSVSNTGNEHTESASHDTLKASAAFVIWGIVLLVVSPLAGLPLYSALLYTGFRYIDAGALGFMGFVSVAGTIVGLVLLLIGIYRALTAVHVGAREAARASGRLITGPQRDAAPEERLDDPNPAPKPESTIIVRRD
ncbi:hypothetical protein [Zhihengliuella flava]|uniref:Membrane protein n=1 Tax=Zhihengliuella flava TaxID=1285193 RepID=A0A931D7G5_9MICC|nr:hypothetical protein [Zhihengliuella flava]MBG6083812.1 putative membrane protein [Zhihengliuella flava]